MKRLPPADYSVVEAKGLPHAMTFAIGKKVCQKMWSHFTSCKPFPRNKYSTTICNY